MSQRPLPRRPAPPSFWISDWSRLTLACYHALVGQRQRYLDDIRAGLALSPDPVTVRGMLWDDEHFQLMHEDPEFRRPLERNHP